MDALVTEIRRRPQGTVEYVDRDELLPLLLADARHAQPSDRAGFLWIRPLDVAGMLASRSYLVSGQVVLEVVDSAGLAGGRFAAGLIDEHSTNAVAKADAMFRSPVTPWCTTWF